MRVFVIKSEGREYVAYGENLPKALSDRGGITGLWKEHLLAGLVEEFTPLEWAAKKNKEVADASKRTA